MIKKSTLAAVIAGVVASAFVAVNQAQAFPGIRSEFFTAYPSATGTALDTLTSPNVPNHCGVCHYDFNGGGPRNPYGQAVEASAQNAAAIAALGGDDSDGDGFTNDEEILGVGTASNTPTFPGLAPGVTATSTQNVDLGEIQNSITPALGVPAVSDWGMAALTFMLLAGGTIIWRKTAVV